MTFVETRDFLMGEHSAEVSKSKCLPSISHWDQFLIQLAEGGVLVWLGFYLLFYVYAFYFLFVSFSCCCFPWMPKSWLLNHIYFSFSCMWTWAHSVFSVPFGAKPQQFQLFDWTGKFCLHPVWITPGFLFLNLNQENLKTQGSNRHWLHWANKAVSGFFWI